MTETTLGRQRLRRWAWLWIISGIATADVLLVAFAGQYLAESPVVRMVCAQLISK